MAEITKINIKGVDYDIGGTGGGSQICELLINVNTASEEILAGLTNIPVCSQSAANTFLLALQGAVKQTLLQIPLSSLPDDFQQTFNSSSYFQIFITDGNQKAVFATIPLSSRQAANMDTGELVSVYSINNQHFSATDGTLTIKTAYIEATISNQEVQITYALKITTQ